MKNCKWGVDVFVRGYYSGCYKFNTEEKAVANRDERRRV